MEKFRSTADPSTGIHPFIPPRIHLLRPFFRPLLTAIRLPFFLLLFSPYILLNSLLFCLPALLSHPCRRLLDSCFLPFILLSLSVIPISPKLEKPRVRHATVGKHPSRGDIILQNFSSPIDLLLLSLAYSPTFALPSENPTHLHSLTLAQALFKYCSSTPPSPSSAPQPVMHLLRATPVCVLAEACSTNGRGVLRFHYTPTSVSIPDTTTVYAAGLSYTPRGAACITTQSLPEVLLAAMGEWRILPRIRITAVPCEGADHQSCVATLCGVPPLKIDREAGRQFVHHWRQTVTVKA